VNDTFVNTDGAANFDNTPEPSAPLDPTSNSEPVPVQGQATIPLFTPAPRIEDADFASIVEMIRSSRKGP
jgi:acetaldehyde dehydrogenase (acetylating)